ncbi:Serine/threonine-protein kinase smg1, partial [Nowakowskiella sp. JEL0078]
MSERMKSRDSAKSYQTIISSLKNVEELDRESELSFREKDFNITTLVIDVETMIREFQRITVLWDETWFHKLGFIQADVIKRFEKLDRESERVRSNNTLSAVEKGKILKDTNAFVMKPIVHAIERLCASTIQSGKGLTPHESEFSRIFGQKIDFSLETLRSSENPKDGWEGFKEIYKELQKEMQKIRLLKLSDISPYLSTSDFTSIPVPGLPFNDSIVTINGIKQSVKVLPTKTKPKKIDFEGSNGKVYSFLFKGLEDLHLDERVMQFLTTANELLACDKDTSSRRLRALNYAVIPFGDNFGMIQWVDNMLELFALFKKWQQRDHAAKLLQKKESDQKSNIPANPPRPHELYYNKLTATLKKHNISRSAPRKNWTMAVMRETFRELSLETPSDLLAKAFWSASSTSSMWWEKVQVYSRSLAVMSIIGYVIGLGDRHLDNILVDLSRGEVLHIDYNVCFEKGRRLKIPETIPFRLTRNLKSALGPLSSVEGTFRIACEHTLRVLRQNKEILLTLLEAFVYDPLVDWT